MKFRAIYYKFQGDDKNKNEVVVVKEIFQQNGRKILRKIILRLQKVKKKLYLSKLILNYRDNIKKTLQSIKKTATGLEITTT